MPPPCAGVHRRLHSDGHRGAFFRHRGIFPSDKGSGLEPKPGLESCLPPRTPIPGPRTRREDRVLLIVQMSSDRLFLAGCSPAEPAALHRHAQLKSVAGSKKTVYHRTATSVLTGCLTSGGKRTFVR